jgi:acetyl esterase/lipase
MTARNHLVHSDAYPVEKKVVRMRSRRAPPLADHTQSDLRHLAFECVLYCSNYMSRLSITTVIPTQHVRAIRRHYGRAQSQYGHLHVSKADPERGLIILVHGGFWRSHRALSMTTPMAQALAQEGWNVWNVEYRRGSDGRWRETLADIAAATDYASALAEELGLEINTTVLVGHSAGAHLAAWAAARIGGIGAAPAEQRVLCGLVTLNGVLDLAHAAALGIGDDAVRDFLGVDRTEAPEIYGMADPVSRLPIGVPSRCLHSREDERVPFVIAERFIQAAQEAGDDAELVEIAGEHNAPIEPHTQAWRSVLAVLDSLETPFIGSHRQPIGSVDTP